MATMCSSFDLEEMDADEREELEALLYAQIHHTASDLTPASDNLVNHAGVSTDAPTVPSGMLVNGLGCSPSPLGSKEQTVAGVVSSAEDILGASADSPGTTTVRNSQNERAEQSASTNKMAATKINFTPSSCRIQQGSDNKFGVSTSRLGSQTPAGTISGAESPQRKARPSMPKKPTPGSKLSTTASKRPRSPTSSGDEPETKTAALAAGGRRDRHGRRRSPPRLPLPTGPASGSSSESSEDEFVLEVGQAAPARAAPAAPAAPAAGSARSPEVVALDDDEVVQSGGSSAPEILEAQEEASGPTPARAAARRVRTSSDLSSSDDSDGGAALAADDCDIRMNVLGAGPSVAGGVICSASEPEEEDDVQVQETEDDSHTIPPPAYRGVLAAAHLTPQERRQLEPLCAVRPCRKWSEQLRRDYSTPKHYGPGDVESIRAAMSDDGWVIPSEYLPRPAGKAARGRYYANLQRNRCRRCDGVGHVMASCPLPPVCHLCGARGHSGEYRCPNMFCYMCGRSNHTTQRCPRHFRPVYCALCKAPGHTSDQCPDRWRRYHATTTAGGVVEPPPALQNRPTRHVYCWECGEKGHHGHQCGGERYTSAASLSQHVISYTETTCPASGLSGLVATPAQMDAVFAPRRRRQIETDTGATLTYEKLGDKAWMINISGSLEAATAAHEQVQAVMQGRKRPRPRANSAPASPVPVAEPGGASSAPASPQPEEAGARDGREAARQRRQLLKEARLAERRRRRQARAAARQAAAAAASPPVIELDAASAAEECVELSEGSEEVTVVSGSGEEVTVVDEVAAAPAAAQRRAAVELVTIISDEEDVERLSAGCETDASLDALAAAGRVWRLRLLDGDGEHSVDPDQMSARRAWKLNKAQRKRLRKKMLKTLVASAGVDEEQDGTDPSEETTPSEEVTPVEEDPAARARRRARRRKRQAGRGRAELQEARRGEPALENGAAPAAVNGDGR